MDFFDFIVYKFPALCFDDSRKMRKFVNLLKQHYDSG